MKELSIEEKAQRYDEVIKRAKSIDVHEYGDIIEAIFPELRESEDERIKLKLIEAVKRDMVVGGTKDKQLAVAWLEKQGEHANFLNKIQIGDKVTRNEDGVLVNLSQLKRVAKPADKVEPKFNINDCIIKKHNSNINDFGHFIITDIVGGKYWYNDRIICDISEQDEWELYELIEENHVWNKKDEHEVAVLEGYIRSKDWSESHIDRALGIVDELVNKAKVLKPFKERYTWKPTDAQMKALSAINVTGNISYVGQGQELVNLYNDLKKLKG